MEGSELFSEVDGVLREHYYLKEPWQYAVSTIWVFEAWLAPVLPVVFYLSIGGPVGSGKTNFLYLLAELTDALKFENVSIAALAREIDRPGHPCRPVVIDELSRKGDRELMEVRDSLLRQGYKADSAPYTRWDYRTGTSEKVPIYSAKAFGFTGTIETALQSRCFAIPSVTPKPGRDSFAYVTRNWYPKTRGLPELLKQWKKETLAKWTSAKIEELISTKDYIDKVEQATTLIGANRESELTGIAMLVAEIVGVDVIHELKSAQELREIEIFSTSDADVDAFQSVIMAYIKSTDPETVGELERHIIRVKQSDIKREWDDYRRSYQGLHAMSPYAFAELRDRVGVPKAALTVRGSALWWNLNEDILAVLSAGSSTSSAHSGPPYLPYLPLLPSTDTDVKVGRVGRVARTPPASGSEASTEAVRSVLRELAKVSPEIPDTTLVAHLEVLGLPDEQVKQALVTLKFRAELRKVREGFYRFEEASP